MKKVFEVIRIDDADIEYSFGIFDNEDLATLAVENLSEIYDENELMIIDRNLVEKPDEIQDELAAKAHEYDLEEEPDEDDLSSEDSLLDEEAEET